MLTRAALASALCLAPVLPDAHPHIFVEARMAVEVAADGSITGVRLSWLYDDLFSLLLTADLGIDMDGDMVLTEEEFALLDEAVRVWPEDFLGDLWVQADGAAVNLLPKDEDGVGFEDGKVEERFRRVLSEPVPPGTTAVIRVFDPYYYVAYALAEPVEVIGADDCEVVIERADLDRAFDQAAEVLGGRLPSEFGPEEEIAPVGGLFADTVFVTCPG